MKWGKVVIKQILGPGTYKVEVTGEITKRHIYLVIGDQSSVQLQDVAPKVSKDGYPFGQRRRRHQKMEAERGKARVLLVG